MVKGFLREFREFAMRGNVMDMAVGIIIGAAFGKIVSSFVADVIMPPLGFVMGQVDFKDKFIDLARGPKEVKLQYGLFINAVIDFILVAFAIFLMIKGINKLKRQPPPPPPTAPDTRECPHCVSKISIRATRCPQCTSEVKPLAA